MNKLKKHGVEKIMMVLCFAAIFPYNLFKNNNRVNWKIIEVKEK
jgi:hypothetical protein